MKHQLVTSSARLDDAAALAAFLSTIPNGEQLGTLLKEGEAISTRAYDDDTDSARFVTSDGIIAMCFTVSPVTIDQAEMIASATELRPIWTAEEFGAAVDEALATL
jgi:hypothetical protein